MSKKIQLDDFSLEELKRFKSIVTQVESKTALLEAVDKIIAQKEYEQTQSLNARFPVDWFNIDPDYIVLLHKNGIDNLAQLRAVENIHSLSGMTEMGYRQISWARDFFDMTPFEQIPESKRTMQKQAEVAVKQAQKCYKKHGNV